MKDTKEVTDKLLEKQLLFCCTEKKKLWDFGVHSTTLEGERTRLSYFLIQTRDFPSYELFSSSTSNRDQLQYDNDDV